MEIFKDGEKSRLIDLGKDGWRDLRMDDRFLMMMMMMFGVTQFIVASLLFEHLVFLSLAVLREKPVFVW